MTSLVDCNTSVSETSAMGEVKTNGEPEGPHTSADWKIWAYSTAAPSFIASGCTVVDIDGTILREGTNGWTALWRVIPEVSQIQRKDGKIRMKQCQWLQMLKV